MKALLVVDPQYDFFEGSLKIDNAKSIIPIINTLMTERKWDLIIGTQDWHPRDHISFTENNPGTKDFQSVVLSESMTQTMWPIHCVQNTKGSEFDKSLKSKKFDYIVRKGTSKKIDSYSAFFENDKLTSTYLGNLVQGFDIYITGLASDVCCYYTALDALKFSNNVYFIIDATAPVSIEQEQKCFRVMEKEGIHLLNSYEMEKEE
jgi:nicotinamidase/pyrazinamidase